MKPETWFGGGTARAGHPMLVHVRSDGDLLAVGRSPGPRVVIAASGALALSALERGAIAIVTEDATSNEIAVALREAREGRDYVSAAAALQIVEHLRAQFERQVQRAASDHDLTEREHEVLTQLAECGTYEEVAAALGISINTVRAHIRALYAKLDACTRTEALMTALDRGLLPMRGQR
jgi:DNA-binding NarL/FixJ family response regulator